MVHRFQYCGHTCTHNDAAASSRSRRTESVRGCFIMHTEGSSLLRHLKSSQMHPNCKRERCPAHSFICENCTCAGEALPPCRSRDPTHDEWVTWGRELYSSLQKDSKRKDWPLYYRDMACGGSVPPAPGAGIDIWNMLPPQTRAIPVAVQPMPTSHHHSRPALTNSQRIHRHMTSNLANCLSAVIVEDISRKHMQDNHQTNMEWAHTRMPTKLASMMLNACPYNVVWDNEGKNEDGDFGYYILEYLYLAIEMYKLGWDVQFMTWANFRNAVCSMEGLNWKILCEVDIVIGGADLGVDYMNPDKEYGFTLQKLDTYLAGAVKLSEVTTIWPHPVDLIQRGHKVIQTRSCAEVATSMGFPYPFLTTIRNVDDLDHLGNQDIIIKRTYSGYSQHVLFGNAGDYQLKSKLKAEMDLTDKHWWTLPPHRQPVWFMQPLLPTMREKCEVRCFFVGMTLLYSIMTHFVNGEMEVHPLWGCLPLHSVMPGKYNRKVSQNAKHDRQCYDVYEPAAATGFLESGKEELLGFASAMLRGLVEKEEQQHQVSPFSGLPQFARLDIGILQNRQNEKFSFWLNDVQCGHCTSMFSKSAAHGTVDRLAPILVHLLEEVVLDKRQDIGMRNTGTDNM